VVSKCLGATYFGEIGGDVLEVDPDSKAGTIELLVSLKATASWVVRVLVFGQIHYHIKSGKCAQSTAIDK
jgi:hypothetical protein